MTECTILVGAGEFCDRPVVPLAPFPICESHLRDAWLFGRDWFVQATSAALDRVREQWAAEAPAMPPPPDTNRVYYLSVGPYIKIGTTNHLRSRLAGYPPDALLLATEVGGRDVEGDRLRWFARHLAHGREWFHRHPCLMAHIDSLAETGTTTADRATVSKGT